MGCPNRLPCPADTIATAGYTRQRIASASFPIGSEGFPDQDIWDAGFDAFWEVDVFGRIRRGVQAQGALVGAAEEDLRNVRVSLAAEVARAYFELRGAQELLAVAQRNGQNQRRTLELTRERLEGGRGTAFDTERAQTQLSSTLALIPPFEHHVLGNARRDGASLTLHVYGGEMDHCHVFEPAGEGLYRRCVKALAYDE